MRPLPLFPLLTALALVYPLHASTILEKVDIEPVWSGHSVGFDLLLDGDRQYAAYFDAERRMTVASRRIGDASWKIKKLDSVLGWDSHNYVQMALDRQGYLHVSGNMHSDPLVYFRSSKPHDVSTLEKIPAMTGAEEDRITYPLFYHAADGSLLFMFRDGGSGNGKSLLNIYDETTRLWRRHTKAPLFDGVAENKSAYPSAIRKGPDGWFHLAWMWRDTPDCSSNHKLCYAKSPDLKEWQNAAGKPISLPLTPSLAEVVVDPVGPNLGMINVNFSVGFDAEKRPIINYHKHDEKGNSQIYLARFEDKDWKIRPVTNWTSRWAPSGQGTIEVEASSSTVTTLSDGRLVMSWAKTKEDSERVTLDPLTLTKTGTYHVPQMVPKELGQPFYVFPGMSVRWESDSASIEERSAWMLRWESRGAFRDSQPEGDIPKPTMLTLYHFAE